IVLDREGRIPFVQMPGLALRQARFLAATHRERRARERSDGDTARVVAFLPDERVDAESAAVTNERIARAIAAIDRLTPAQKRVFRRVLADPPPSHAEIAAVVGLSEQRVKQIVCEVRAQLRRALAEEQQR
ncbi:MAG TPA: sigma factor-like helix-turn-helix DNA-binding protein, partial [Myxococcota bacterium]